ncbi:hypothetical protein [Planobispora longispora]|uniref:Uncharacterized protein n=1 Tax=Planobispora longispora TaxID=28887 RepID=A0A8J3RIY8_9ACTN|nr:hypothetical protein [Planobispora longispora]GIH74697.1 hypothetical protein Plo01_11260 [Planobispora longispora]
MSGEDGTRRQVYAGRRAAVIPAVRPGPLTLVWWWRYEIMLAAGLPVAFLWAAGAFGWLPVVLMALGLVASVLVWPTARREVWGRIRCVYTAHRIRSGCVEAIIMNRRGRIPAVLWTVPTRFGERVWLWCRAGTTAADLEGAAGLLASCCLAPVVQVSAHPRYPALVVVDVVRDEKAWADSSIT